MRVISSPAAQKLRSSARTHLKRRLSTIPVGRRQPIPFVIVARARTGSNHLIDMLNASRRVFCVGEIFSDLTEEQVDEVYRDWRTRVSPWIAALGCKLFYYHPLAGPESKLWRALEADRAVRIIHLRRLDTLAALVSLRLAEVTGKWFRRPGESGYEDTRVRLEAHEIEFELRRTRAWERECDARFAAHPLLQLTYEELVSERQAVMDRVFGFLGVPPVRRPVSGLVKQTSLPARSQVENFSDLQAHFAGTEWEAYFTAP